MQIGSRSQKIITAQDVASALGYPNTSARQWMMAHAHKLFLLKQIKFDCSGETIKRYSVRARIDAGRWISDCPICYRSNYVDPADPVFFCFGCGNQGSECFVPVIFPEDNVRTEIERLLLERTMICDPNDDNPLSQALNAKPQYPGLARYWNDQSTEELNLINQVVMEKQHD